MEGIVKTPLPWHKAGSIVYIEGNKCSICRTEKWLYANGEIWTTIWALEV